MTTLQELIKELESIKQTKCKTLQELVFFDGVLAIIEGKYIEKEKQEKRELLIQFFKFFRDNGEANIGLTIEDFVDLFFKNFNK